MKLSYVASATVPVPKVAVNLVWQGQPQRVYIGGGVWTGGPSELLAQLKKLHLMPGHHYDRDLELAQLAAKYFQGTVLDIRHK